MVWCSFVESVSVPKKLAYGYRPCVLIFMRQALGGKRLGARRSVAVSRTGTSWMHYLNRLAWLELHSVNIAVVRLHWSILVLLVCGVSFLP